MPQHDSIKLRALAENLLNAKENSLDDLSAQDIGRLVHDLHVHQIELEAQNEELRIAQERLEEIKNRYQDLFFNAPLGYLEIKNEQGHIIEGNRTASALLGVDPGMLPGSYLLAYCDVRDRDNLYRHLRSVLKRRKRQSCELRFCLTGGQTRYTLAETQSVPGQSYLRMALLDITTRREAERRQRLASAVFENTADGILVTDPEGRILAVNPAFTQITGYASHEAVGQSINMLKSERQDPVIFEHIRKEIEERGSWQGEIWNRRKNGEIYPEWISINAVADEEYGVSQYVGIFSDISQQEYIKKRLHQLAYYDPLTDLPNRQLFHDRLRNALNLAKRDRHQLAILFLDLDRFKNINDSLGHTVGDHLLMFVAIQLKGCLRASDTVARLGGDEFVIILPRIHHSDDAAHMAENILETFHRQHFSSHDEALELPVTISIGISLYPDDAVEDEGLIKCADIAMYRAKEAGRDNYQFYSEEMSKRILARINMEKDLGHALEHGEFSLVYQPKVSLKNGFISGCEALLRWHHPTQGLILPERFIPLAEETGLIHAIGDWVIVTALEESRSWTAHGQNSLRISINLSGKQLSKSGLEELLSDMLNRCPQCSLELELTESVLMEQAEKIPQALARLKKLGAEISIDDFGTGYSSLAYLKRFPIDNLKIDRSFVHDIGRDRSSEEIVSAIISMGRNLGLKVIAEGVETEEQLNYLKIRGCDEMQGFLFSRPVSAETLGRLLNHELESNPGRD